ncbi:hypothetical protein SUGI_0960890 [Cryptomeria japonica]|nr:hypothetical protein SUGI_0960890 [Cryptomeria japonica]
MRSTSGRRGGARVSREVAEESEDNDNDGEDALVCDAFFNGLVVSRLSSGSMFLFLTCVRLVQRLDPLCVGVLVLGFTQSRNFIPLGLVLLFEACDDVFYSPLFYASIRCSFGVWHLPGCLGEFLVSMGD